MPLHRVPRFRIGVLLMFAVGALASAASADIKHGVVYYSPANSQVRTLTAQRYDLGITGFEISQDVLAIKAQNPNFEWYVYNSATDNYVSGSSTPEEQLLQQIAAGYGVDAEEGYLHFWDDTRVILEGDTVFVPGWGGGSAQSKAEARVPVYYKSLSRRMVNFGSPVARQLHREVFVRMAFDQPFSGSNLFADGIFLDNSSYISYNTGKIVSGGHVLEVPGRPEAGSPAFQTWFWADNFGPFLTSLKDTLETSPSWSPDGKRKKVMINISNSWTDTFVTWDTADVFCMEFQYHPVRNKGMTAVLESWARDKLAHDAGMATWHLSQVTTSDASYSGSFTYDEAMMGAIAWFLNSRSPSTYHFLIGTFSPSRADWDQVTWNGALDVIDAEFGEALGDPYVVKSGTDPVGYPYNVIGRRYQGGFALVRARGAWNENFGPETTVTVNLPDTFRRLSPAGTAGSPVNSVPIRNGEGIILLNEDGIGGGGGAPGAPENLLGSFIPIATSPRDGAADVPPGTEVRIHLHDALPSGGIPSGWLTVAGSASGLHTGTLSLEQEGRLLVFRPASPFTPGETVSARLSELAHSSANKYLDANRDGVGSGTAADRFEFTFSVMPQ